MNSFEPGYDFETASGLETGAHLNDLLRKAKLVSGTTELTDNATIEVATGSVGKLRVKAGGIDTDQLADESVTTAKLADGSVTADKLAGSAVYSTRQAAAAQSLARVTWEDLAFGTLIAESSDFYEEGNKRWKPTVAGVYLVTASAILQRSDGYSWRGMVYLSIRKNGNIVFEAAVNNAMDSGIHQRAGGALSGVVALNGSTDYVTVSVYHEAKSNVDSTDLPGAGVTIDTATYATFGHIALIART